MEENEQYLSFAKSVAIDAGKIMLKYFDKDDITSIKGDRTLVTLADKEINEYLIKRVKETFPNHSVDGEEDAFGKSNYAWVCDPIDGTAMYTRHVPVAVFSLALVVDGKPVIGVVYDPFMNNLYSASIGKGAFLNDKRISVSEGTFNKMASLGHVDFWEGSDYNSMNVLKDLSKQTYIVAVGSIIRAAMCVASGGFLFAVFPGTKHKNCDIAAAKVIVEEAGGKVTDFFGDEQRYDISINGAVITNGIVHDEVINTIKKYNENLKK